MHSCFIVLISSLAILSSESFVLDSFGFKYLKGSLFTDIEDHLLCYRIFGEDTLFYFNPNILMHNFFKPIWSGSEKTKICLKIYLHHQLLPCLCTHTTPLYITLKNLSQYDSSGMVIVNTFFVLLFSFQMFMDY